MSGPEPEPDEAALERSLAQIEAGGITPGAERRLAQLTEERSYTSALSVGGFALCHRLGLRPVCQVMGSSIYQVGFQPSWYMNLGGSILTELDVLSDAWNQARSRAIDRLSQEARLARADAVVGVDVQAGLNRLEGEAIEYVITGTAVRRGDGTAHASAPVLTELSVADYAKLIDAGYEPVGIVAHTAVFLAVYTNNWLGEPGGLGNPIGNFELEDFTAGVYAAREQVMGELNRQAAECGAAGIVDVRIKHDVHRQEVPTGPGFANSAGQQRGAMIVFDAIGTAIGSTGESRGTRAKSTIDLSI